MTHNRDLSEASVSMKDDMIKLIAKQRLFRLIEGARFYKYSSRGQRLKDKYWYCRLSPNKREIHYGDWDDHTKEPSLDELPNKINVTDIKGILIGKDCPLTKEGHMKKSSIDLVFSLLYEFEHEEYLNFIALDHKTSCYWIDGINHLLKNDMTSDQFHKDLALLLEVEIKIKTMDNG